MLPASMNLTETIFLKFKFQKTQRPLLRKGDSHFICDASSKKECSCGRAINYFNIIFDTIIFQPLKNCQLLLLLIFQKMLKINLLLLKIILIDIEENKLVEKCRNTVTIKFSFLLLKIILVGLFFCYLPSSFFFPFS